MEPQSALLRVRDDDEVVRDCCEVEDAELEVEMATELNACDRDMVSAAIVDKDCKKLHPQLEMKKPNPWWRDRPPVPPLRGLGEKNRNNALFCKGMRPWPSIPSCSDKARSVGPITAKTHSLPTCFGEDPGSSLDVPRQGLVLSCPTGLNLIIPNRVSYPLIHHAFGRELVVIAYKSFHVWLA